MNDEDEMEKDEATVPLYARRPPPLIQPLAPSSFAERIQRTYGVQDLGHEWVALFQTLSGTHGKQSIKAQIPDTVFLSPTGQPSLWYSTTASGQIKPQNLTRVTPRVIQDAFLPTDAVEGIVAIVRRGFEVEYVDATKFRAFCQHMAHARLPGTTLSPRSTKEEEEEEEEEHHQAQEATTTIVTEQPATAYCLQRFVARYRDLTFISVWKQTTQSSALSPRASTKKVPSPSCCDLFLSASRAMNPSSNLCYCGDGTYHEDDPMHVCFRLLPMDNPSTSSTRPHASIEKQLRQWGLEEETIVPQLIQIKLLTSEMVNRVNRAIRTKQLIGFAAEFFIAEIDQRVYFAGLIGIQWENQVNASWEASADVDALASCITAFYQQQNDQMQDTKSARQAVSKENRALRLYHQLNPRFPSVQSPRVAEQQWKARSAFLPPEIAPRYLGAEVPKKFRDGKFAPLLTRAQADEVNRLHLTPTSPTTTTRSIKSSEPLSTSPLSLSARPVSPPTSPTSPRARRQRQL